MTVLRVGMEVSIRKGLFDRAPRPAVLVGLLGPDTEVDPGEYAREWWLVSYTDERGGEDRVSVLTGKYETGEVKGR